MISRKDFENSASSVATLDRSELKRQIRNFRGRFKMDFTEDYLEHTSVDKLRHILFAAMVSAAPHN